MSNYEATQSDQAAKSPLIVYKVAILIQEFLGRALILLCELYS